jgi:hypothetical protein
MPKKVKNNYPSFLDGASSNLKDGYKNYTIDPSTRYRNISAKIDHERILPLYDSGMDH